MMTVCFTRNTTSGTNDRNRIKFRCFAAARVALTAGPAVWVICRPQNLEAWLPPFERLDHETIGSRIWDLKVPTGS